MLGTDNATVERRLEKDDVRTGSSDDGDAAPYDPDIGLSPEQRAEHDKKLIQKLDWTLMPWLCLLYLIAFLDRTNIGNAKIAHLTRDVPMTPIMFGHTLTVFFIGYSLFEAIANMMLKKWRPSIFIPAIMTIWGVIMMAHGFVRNWSDLMAARFFLGVLEAGLFPGVNYYLSCWYKRSEFGIRAAIFFAAAALSGSFGGLLAGAIEKLNGAGGKPGWAWIFIIEGLATVVVGIISFWMVQDFPDTATFLTPDDRARVHNRLRRDMQASANHEKFQWKWIMVALRDWKTWVAMLIYMGPLMPLYSFSLFLPTIISQLSFTTSSNVIRNQLLSVPPYAVACVATVLVGWLSDKSKRRGIFLLSVTPIGIVGFIMTMASTNAKVQYAGTFLGAIGIYPCIPLSIAWVANNVEGVYKRGVVLGFMIGWGNLNGIVSSYIYSRPPRFFAGHGTVIAYMFLCTWMGSLIMWIGLKLENRKRLRGDRDGWTKGLTPQQITECGDRRPDFIYTL